MKFGKQELHNLFNVLLSSKNRSGGNWCGM